MDGFPHQAVILGGGKGGAALLALLLDEELIEVAAVVDLDPKVPGIQLAAKHGIPTYTDCETALRRHSGCIAFNLTLSPDVDRLATAMLGAENLVGGLEARLMWEMVTKLQKAKDQLRFQASHDALTGLYNRRYMVEQLQNAIALSMRYHTPLSLVLIDIDHFKSINDTHGHAAGDMVLRQIARLLRDKSRSADIVGRWGGEEFLVIMPHTEAHEARVAGTNWLESIRQEPIDIGPGKSLLVSFSAGVSSMHSSALNLPSEKRGDALVEAADEKLYQAKSAGRCRVAD